MNSSTTCRWDGGWTGRCKELAVDGEFCNKHQGQRCVSCGKQAIRECCHTGIQFACGAPLCATCQHGIPEPGNSGWFMLGGGHVTAEVYQQQLDRSKSVSQQQSEPERKPMPMHEIINTIQSRLRSKLEFTLIERDFVQFRFAHQTLHCYESAGKLHLRHILDTGQMAESLHSKYWEGVLNGGKRDDAGNLIVETNTQSETKP